MTAGRSSFGLSTLSSTALTVTVCGVSHSPGLKVRVVTSVVMALWGVITDSSTFTSAVGRLVSTTVYVPLLSSSSGVLVSSVSSRLRVFSDTFTPRVSSSVIVPLASVSPAVVLRVAFVGAPSLIAMVSSSSSTRSPFTSMTMLPEVSPAAMVTDFVAGSV